MTDNTTSAIGIATSGMRAQAVRLRHTAENIANTDTPGYRRKLSSFHQQLHHGRPTGAVVSGRTILDNAPLPRFFQPGHPMAGDDGYYESSNVDVIIEMADSREASRSYEANLRVFEKAREMDRSILELIRR